MIEVIPFGEYLPDLPDLANPGATVAKNVIPHANSYLPLKALSTNSDALTAFCRGAYAATDKALVVYNFAGDATKLYSLASQTHSDVSSTTYTTAAGENWSFVKWGEKIIATNFTDVPEITTLGAANFTNLGGSPPRARHVGIVRDFVVFGYLKESGTVYPNRVRWSGIGDETAWAVSATTQSDFQDIFSNANLGGGDIQSAIL